MRVAVFGLGYVGTVTMACLVELGHNAIGVDVQQEKVDALNAGISPVKEPGLGPMIARSVEEGLLSATMSASEAVALSDVAFVSVGTPAHPGGQQDTSHVSRVIADIASALQTNSKEGYRIFNRSTCLPHVHRDLLEDLKTADVSGVDYVVHPEFLREGSAIKDFLSPPLVVFGGDWTTKPEWTSELYPGVTSPHFYLTLEEAALVKYASNMFHAVKATFANEIGLLSTQYGVDARKVMDVVCEDKVLNVSNRYLRPGMPFGGSCLPKDVSAVVQFGKASNLPLPMFGAVLKSNEAQSTLLIRRLLANNFRSVALIGLAFKSGTDDLRNSPLVSLVKGLTSAGLKVSVWDPVVRPEELVGVNREEFQKLALDRNFSFKAEIREAVAGADAVLIGHQLDEHTLVRLDITRDQTVFDLVGSVDPTMLSGPYEGLYWS